MERDPWARWLLERRFAGDPNYRRDAMRRLFGVRDRLLDNADLTEGETVLDVGCGDGLIGFGALERGAGLVIFSDISEELLTTCMSIAADLDVGERCRFVRANAEDLTPIEDPVDVVTTRSVLIYVENKERAFAEFRRVLRPGGRISLFEPINSLSTFLTAYPVGPVQDLLDRVHAVFHRIQPPDTDPLLNFDDRDLVVLAEQAGFREIRLQLDVESKPPKPHRWETYLRTVANPKIPSLGEAMEQALTSEERARLAAHLCPLVEEGRGRLRTASAYLQAVKETVHG